MAHHAPFEALGPIEWQQLPQGDDLQTFLDDIFAHSETILESVPGIAPAPQAQSHGQSPAAAAAAAPDQGRARSKTESDSADPNVQRALARVRDPGAIAHAQQLRKEWKDVKVNQRDNPLGVAVYKLSAKDSKGAWFARRSLHEGLSFDRWKRGIQCEFEESIKVQGGPGSGNIRGIGAERRVERVESPKGNLAEVFQLSAQFGPVTPREFITLLLTSDTSCKYPGVDGPPLRQYMIVSKPCDHTDCPPRQGIIRGQYESVEIIREVPAPNAPSSKSPSSVDLKDDTRLSDAAKLSNSDEGISKSEGTETAIEWLMITRSDPGGSIPRFMIEKGTPPGIVGDAGKFVKWVSEFTAPNRPPMPAEGAVSSSSDPGARQPSLEVPASAQDTRSVASEQGAATKEPEVEGVPTSGGLYGMFSGALEAASSVVAGGLRMQPEPNSDSHSTQSVKSDLAAADDDDSSSDASSVRSFASALERTSSAEQRGHDDAPANPGDKATTAQEKELRKLQERRRKLDEKTAKMQERMLAKKDGDREKDAAALAKLREKHDKEMAKQEAKYQRELRRLEEKHDHDARKAEARRKKAAEREDKANLALELDRVKAERDVALKQVQILEGQVGELQSQNTMLVARLGRNGEVGRPASSSVSSSGKDVAAVNGKASPVVS